MDGNLVLQHRDGTLEVERDNIKKGLLNELAQLQEKWNEMYDECVHSAANLGIDSPRGTPPSKSRDDDAGGQDTPLKDHIVDSVRGGCTCEFSKPLFICQFF